MSASVGKQNGVSVKQHEFCVTCHANSVVGQAVQQNHSVAIVMLRMDGPGAKSDAVASDERNIFQSSVKMASKLTLCISFF